MAAVYAPAFYSSRSVTAGSTRVARHAGTEAAAKATIARTLAAKTNEAASSASTAAAATVKPGVRESTRAA